MNLKNMTLKFSSIFIFGFILAIIVHSSYGNEEDEAIAWLSSIEQELGDWCYETVESKWSYSVDMTEAKKIHSLEVGIGYSNYKRSLWEKAKTFPRNKFKNATLVRLLKYMSNIQTEALDYEDVELYETVVQNMSTIYGIAKLCHYTNKSQCDLALSPHILNVYAESRDYDELAYYWSAWRDASGKQMMPQFVEYVRLNQKAAELNGFKDTYEMWLDTYETPDLEQKIFAMWEQIKPFYSELHAYVRRFIIQQYPDRNISEHGLIPAHLFGDMWAQNWVHIVHSSLPFKGTTNVDVSAAMLEQGYTPKRMFELAEDFFTSLGFEKLPQEFWNASVIEKPDDGREITCHPSAWDFCNAKDFRIRMCTQVSQRDLLTIHHELGHIFYYMAYKHLALYFRDSANDGFHEAVGDTIAYSVGSPKHLKELGLLKEIDDSKEYEINFLYTQAMAKVPFLPYALVLEKWRWDAFQNKTQPRDYNCKYWKYRREFQGIKPPCVRKSTDFDPGAKYHVPASVPYLRYFIAAMSELMFHKSACIEAKEYDPNDPSKPLYNCDIHKSKEAGEKLRSMLKLGSSVSWQDALKAATGESDLSASAFLEYFKPIYDWLKKENAKNGVKIGWDDDGEHLCVQE